MFWPRLGMYCVCLRLGIWGYLFYSGYFVGICFHLVFFGGYFIRLSQVCVLLGISSILDGNLLRIFGISDILDILDICLSKRYVL